MNKKAMHKLSYGLYIVTTKDGEKANGCIVNTAIQAASTFLLYTSQSPRDP